MIVITLLFFSFLSFCYILYLCKKYNFRFIEKNLINFEELKNLDSKNEDTIIYLYYINKSFDNSVFFIDIFNNTRRFTENWYFFNLKKEGFFKNGELTITNCIKFKITKIINRFIFNLDSIYHKLNIIETNNIDFSFNKNNKKLCLNSNDIYKEILHSLNSSYIKDLMSEYVNLLDINFFDEKIYLSKYYPEIIYLKGRIIKTNNIKYLKIELITDDINKLTNYFYL